MKRGFGSDNHSGICQEILNSLGYVNVDHALAYGDDEYCLNARELFKSVFGEKAEVYFVFNGTGANVLNIDLMCGSHHAVVCSETAHINVDECGAPQRIVGCRLLTVATPDGKLTPELVRPKLVGFGFEHHSQPKAISISQPTELGTLYTLKEISDLADLAHANNMFLHVDGARLANAAVAMRVSFKQLTTDLGVDCVSFGGTKNGMMIGESVVLLNPVLNVDVRYRRKQMAQLGSKLRFVAAQFQTYLADGLWEKNAIISNRMAQLLFNSVKSLPALEVIYEVQANSVFVKLPRVVWQRLQKEYFFYDWDFENDVVRWMCSFDTTEEDVHTFVETLKNLLSEYMQCNI